MHSMLFLLGVSHWSVYSYMYPIGQKFLTYISVWVGHVSLKIYHNWKDNCSQKQAIKMKRIKLICLVLVHLVVGGVVLHFVLSGPITSVDVSHQRTSLECR